MTTVGSYYAQPTPLTDLTECPSVDGLPTAVDALVRVIHGLLVYDVVAHDFYGVDVPADRADEIHIRRMSDLVESLRTIDDEPLERRRPAERRLFARCRHYAVLLTALLRHRDVPARARCGFADYFNPASHEDHWVCEYWNGTRWTLVDAQLDEVWRDRLRIDFDVLDVPRERFLVAGEAWSRCRAGGADPATFGIEFVGHRGLWFIAGNVVRDVAALNKEEMLPWDGWGAQPAPGASLDAGQLDYFGRLADLSREPDAHFADVIASYDDDRVRVPDAVTNLLLGEVQRSATR